MSGRRAHSRSMQWPGKNSHSSWPGADSRPSWPGIVVRRTASLRSPMFRPSRSMRHPIPAKRDHLDKPGDDTDEVAHTFNRSSPRKRGSRAAISSSRFLDSRFRGNERSMRRAYETIPSVSLRSTQATKRRSMERQSSRYNVERCFTLLPFIPAQAGIQGSNLIVSVSGFPLSRE